MVYIKFCIIFYIPYILRRGLYMLKISNLKKSYGTLQVLRDLNFEIQKGEIVFIVGRSGCGKTTLLNLIGGLDAPTVGEITFDGNLIKNQDISFVFQDNNLLPSLSVSNNIAIAKNEYDKEWLNNNISKLGLLPNQKANTLSGGQKQRLSLLRALYKNSKILLLDEPTGNLDQQNSDLVFQQLIELKSKDNIIVVVSHDTKAAYKYGDRIIELGDGEIVSDKYNKPEYTQIDVKDKSDESEHNNVNGTIIHTATNSNKVVSSSEQIALSLNQATQTATNSNKVSSNSHSKFHANTSITYGHIKRSMFGFLLIAILIAFGISLVSICFGINEGAYNIKKSEYIRADADLARVSPISKYDDTYYTSHFDQSEIDILQNNNNVAKFIPNYANMGVNQNNGDIFNPEWKQNYSILSLSLTPQMTFVPGYNYHNQKFKHNPVLKDANVREIEYTDFFKKRLEFLDIEGEFPSSSDEIIIGNAQAKELFGRSSDFLGEQIYLFPTDAQYTFYYHNFKPTEDDTPISDAVSKKVTIVGVNKSFDPISHSNLTYVDYHLTKSLMQSNSTFFSYNLMLDKNIDMRGAGRLRTLNKTDVPSLNDLDLSGNQIAISNSVYQDLLAIHYPSVKLYGEVSYINNLKIFFSPTSYTFYTPIDRNLIPPIYDNTIKIVAVFDDVEMTPDSRFSDTGSVVSNSDSVKQVVVSKDLEDTFKNVGTPYYQVYLNDPLNYNNFQDSINTREQSFIVESNYEILQLRIGYEQKDLTILILIVAIVFLFFVMLSTAIITRLKASKRVYELAVLKSLGFSILRILWLFVYENIFSFVSAFVLSMILYFVSVQIINSLVLNSVGMQIAFPLKWMLLSTISLFVISTAINILFVYKTSKQNVVKLFRNAG